MSLMNDKRGFLDMEVLTSVGFVILFIMAAGATLMGYIWSKKQGMASLPVWQLLTILVAEFFGAYYFASRG